MSPGRTSVWNGPVPASGASSSVLYSTVPLRKHDSVTGSVATKSLSGGGRGGCGRVGVGRS